MTWRLHRMLVAEDVGEANVGHTPSPRLPSGGHVLRRPGALEGGVPSTLQVIANTYASILRNPFGAPDALGRAVTVLLCTLGVLADGRGIRRRNWKRIDLGTGLVGMNEIPGDPAPVTPDALEAWDDCAIGDPTEALSALPLPLSDRLREMLSAVDPFWPAFTRGKTLTRS